MVLLSLAFELGKDWYRYSCEYGKTVAIVALNGQYPY